MFTFNPNLADGGDDLEEGDESVDVSNLGKDPEGDEEEDEINYKEINVNDLLSEYQEAEAASGLSIANPDRLQQLRDDLALASNSTDAEGGAAQDEGAVGGVDEGETSVDIDEDLFDGDDDDLEELEEELEDMTV